MRGMIPDDVFALQGVVDPRISPDGVHVSYVVTRVDREANAYAGTIWLAALDGSGAPRQLTFGPRSDSEPRWSPDGKWLAFISNRDGDSSQLYVLPIHGGEACRLTHLKEDVSDAVWSPDCSSLAFTARVPSPEREQDDESRRMPRRFTRLQYKLDNEGWIGDRPTHVFTVPADGSGDAVQITFGDFEDATPAWSPDGALIAFVSARHADWDTEFVTDVYVIAATGGESRRLTPGGGTFATPAWSPDGKRLVAQRYPSVFDDPRHTQVATVDARGGEMRLLSTGLDRNCAAEGRSCAPRWDRNEVVFTVEDCGNTHLYRVAADGTGEPRLVIGGDLSVSGFDVAGGRLVYTASVPTRTTELFVGERRLTEVGEPFVGRCELCAPQGFTARSADGAEVEAWMMRPAGFEPGSTYPALLAIHGGPFSQYGNGFFDEFQVYAGAGYAVVYCNPRGSSGYGEAWGRAIRGSGDPQSGWGSVDYADCMAVIDEAARRFSFIDTERLGVIGGSYGGYMTSWIVSHSDRFRAAVSERAVNHLGSAFGSSDQGWDLASYAGGWAFEDVTPYLRMSPATYARDITTPLLILHSEDDLRCPLEQAEQLFVTLRLLRRPVEMVIFPKESHGLTRTGSPAHRVQRFEIVLEWFGRYLKDASPSG